MFQRESVLDYIRANGSITSWEAYKELGITQLATRIFELKERGYRFRKERHYFTSRSGKKAYYEEYFLDEQQHKEESNITSGTKIGA